MIEKDIKIKIKMSIINEVSIYTWYIDNTNNM